MVLMAFHSACAEDEPDASDPLAEHLYALQTFVYQPDDTTLSYVALTDTLDVQGELSLVDAREFPSYAFITSVSGKLLVSSGEAPEIIQYEVGADRVMTETARLSFAAYGVPSYGAGLERHWLLNENVAYLTHEVTSRIVWDPTNMVITGIAEDTQLARDVDGFVLDAAFNRPPLFFEGPVLKPFYYRDENWFYFGGTTSIAVYDPQTHAERNILTVACPALEVMSQDESGNTYFSPWTYGPALSLFGEGPAPCIRRVRPDSTLDDAWAPDLTAWTGGRPVHVLRYVGGGKALATVLHVDEVSADFSAGYDPAVALELESHYRLWWLDLDAETAMPVAAIGASGSGFNLATIEGRTFVFVPDEAWTRTTVYELDDLGAATERFAVAGVLNNWIAVR